MTLNGAEGKDAFPRLKAERRYRQAGGAALQFAALLLFWLVLSGRFTPKYVIFGVVSAALVTLLTSDLVSDIFKHEGAGQTGARLAFSKSLRFLAYLPWLLYQIIKANLQVARIVLNPKMPVDPALLQFSTQLKRRVAQVILATSITLTPGTVVIHLEDGRYIVHAIEPGAAGNLIAAKMQNRVGAIFMEKPEPPPDVQWAHSFEELVL